MTLINLESKFAPAYRIKIGGYNPDPKALKRAESGREWRLPEKWDHFKVCRNERDPVTENFLPAPEIMKHYAAEGEDPLDAKPTSLNIVLFSNEIRDVFDEWRALYMSRRCQCRTVDKFVLSESDDKIYTLLGLNEHFEKIDFSRPIIQLAQWDKTQNSVPKVFEIHNETNEIAFIHCPERHCSYVEKKLCKVNSILRCMILEAPELGAVAEFRTTSIHSAMQLKKSLQMVWQLTGGRMAGLQLALRLEPKTVEQGTVFVAHVVYPHGGLLDLKEAAAKYRTAELDIDRRLLIAEASVHQFEETPEEAAHIDAEFYSGDQPGEIVVESAPKADETAPEDEGTKDEESPEETAKNDLPFPLPEKAELSNETGEKKPAPRHEKCPYPTNTVDPSFCADACKWATHCPKYQEFAESEIPWEAAEGARKETFDLFR